MSTWRTAFYSRANPPNTGHAGPWWSDLDTHLTETRPEDERHNLAEILVSRGQCDLKTIERARQVADENGQTLESVLVQLGLVGERGLAEAYGAMLGLPVVAADGYPAEAVTTGSPEAGLPPPCARHPSGRA